jgi:hypothetical protein
MSTEPPAKKPKAVDERGQQRQRVHAWLMTQLPLLPELGWVVFDYWIWDIIELLPLLLKGPVMTDMSWCFNEFPAREMTPEMIKESIEKVHLRPLGDCPVCNNDGHLEKFCRVCSHFDDTPPRIGARWEIIRESSLRFVSLQLKLLDS